MSRSNYQSNQFPQYAPKNPYNGQWNIVVCRDNGSVEQTFYLNASYPVCNAKKKALAGQGTKKQNIKIIPNKS